MREETRRQFAAQRRASALAMLLGVALLVWAQPRLALAWPLALLGAAQLVGSLAASILSNRARQDALVRLAGSAAEFQPTETVRLATLARRLRIAQLAAALLVALALGVAALAPGSDAGTLALVAAADAAALLLGAFLLATVTRRYASQVRALLDPRAPPRGEHETAE